MCYRCICKYFRIKICLNNWCEFAYFWILWHHTWTSGHARHKFWYTDKMLNTSFSDLVTKLFPIYLYNRLSTYHTHISKNLKSWKNGGETVTIVFKHAQPKRSNTRSITANEWVTHLSKLLYNENAHSDAVDYNNNESDEILNADITIDQWWC